MHARVGVLDREDSAVAFEGYLGWIMQHPYRAALANNCTGIGSTGADSWPVALRANHVVEHCHAALYHSMCRPHLE